MIFNLVKNPTLLKSTLSSFPNRKNRKNRKKPVPNLIFSVVFGFFGLQPPPPPPPLKNPDPHILQGVPKAIVQRFRASAYCSAPSYSICKTFSGKFQKSNSFEEYTTFSESAFIFERTFFFYVFRLLAMAVSHPL